MLDLSCCLIVKVWITKYLYQDDMMIPVSYNAFYKIFDRKAKRNQIDIF